MRAIGYYTADGRGGMTGDAFCPDCVPDDGEDLETHEPIFSWTESDSPTHCANRECARLISHSLTSDGLAYVTETAERDPYNAVVQEWVEEYLR